MDTEKTYQKWLRWISETENEVRRLCDARYRFETVRAIVNENPELDWSNRFLDHMRVWYFHYAAMAVRRQLKKNQDFSLIKLLDEIHAIHLFCLRIAIYFIMAMMTLEKNWMACSFWRNGQSRMGSM